MMTRHAAVHARKLATIASIAYECDTKTRAELQVQAIPSEPVYVCALVTRIRDRMADQGIRAYRYTQVLPPKKEQILGCDAVIALVDGTTAKVCLFEAKWPRLTRGRYTWDPIDKPSSRSHFSDQLQRQSRLRHMAAIWELFMLEHAPQQQPAGFDDLASTCVWHEDAYRYDTNRAKPGRPWTNQDLIRLIPSLPYKLRNLHEMIWSALACTQGNRLSISNGEVRLVSNPDGLEVAIPVEFETARERIPAFCRKYGIGHFLLILV